MAIFNSYISLPESIWMGNAQGLRPIFPAFRQEIQEKSCVRFQEVGDWKHGFSAKNDVLNPEILFLKMWQNQKTPLFDQKTKCLDKDGGLMGCWLFANETWS